MPLLRLSSSRFLWLSRSAPRIIPLGLRSYGSWHRQSGALSERSLRLPFLWLLSLRYVPTKRRLAELRLPLP